MPRLTDTTFNHTCWNEVAKSVDFDEIDDKRICKKVSQKTHDQSACHTNEVLFIVLYKL